MKDGYALKSDCVNSA